MNDSELYDTISVWAPAPREGNIKPLNNAISSACDSRSFEQGRGECVCGGSGSGSGSSSRYWVGPGRG